MSSPAPDTTAAAASTTAAISSTPAAPASTATTTPAATTTKKPASLKAVTGFLVSSPIPTVLVNTAHLVAKGVGGNSVWLPEPADRSGGAGCFG